jgi:hypothetical protein
MPRRSILSASERESLLVYPLAEMIWSGVTL